MTEADFNIKIVPLRDKMYRFARAIVNDNDLAQDKVHDVIEKLWRNRRNIDNYTNLEAFVMVSVRNACYDALRHRRIMRNHDMLRESVVEESAIWDMRRMLLKAITSLNDLQRMIVHLKDVEGYETYEIAAMLSLKENNVRTILSRGRREARKMIEKMMNYGIKKESGYGE